MKMDEAALDVIGDDSFSFNGGFCLTITQSDRGMFVVNGCQG